MKKAVTILMALVIVATFIGTFLFLFQRSRPRAEAVRTTLPQVTDIFKKIVATGSVQPRKEIEIKSQVSGIIETISVSEGQVVQMGEILATIRITPNLIQVNEAEARLARARISREDAEQTWRREKRDFERTLKQGALLTDTESPHLIKLRQAVADEKAAALALADAGETYRREKALFEQKIATASQLQDKKHLLDQAVEAHRRAQDMLRLIREETIEAAERAFQRAEMDRRQAAEALAAAERHLQLVREGETAEMADESNTLIRSTIEGMVLEIPVKTGTHIIESNPQNPGTTIAVVADMGDMVFKGQIDETDIGKIRPGMDLRLTIGAIEGETFAATIEQIAPKGKSVEGTIQFAVEARVAPKQGRFIRAGYSASADIILDKREQVLAVEEGNLEFDGAKTYAFVATPDGGFERRELQTGLSDGITIEVVEGLEIGDQIKVLR
ncbi:MAG: HlyD family efflux transporter periplasmic adaptor subunit [Desulfosarcinaceae bacterium]|nr:HlyD family efflux transporter periplasmic adaptor subunit [Desulfosarcinaceae bacterium]